MRQSLCAPPGSYENPTGWYQLDTSFWTNVYFCPWLRCSLGEAPTHSISFPVPASPFTEYRPHSDA